MCKPISLHDNYFDHPFARGALAREFRAKTRAAKTSPTAVLRRATTDYVRQTKTGSALNAMQEHIDARAGRWNGFCSGAELLRRTRP